MCFPALAQRASRTRWFRNIIKVWFAELPPEDGRDHELRVVVETVVVVVVAFVVTVVVIDARLSHGAYGWCRRLLCAPSGMVRRRRREGRGGGGRRKRRRGGGGGGGGGWCP